MLAIVVKRSAVLLKRIARFIRSHDWFAVGVEILVVVIGLLLALQLDRWREEHLEKQQERAYVGRLIADVEDDVPAIEYAIRLQTLRLDLIELLMATARDEKAAVDDPVVFLGAVNQAAYTYTPALTSHTFVNLRSTGDLRLIRSQELKEVLFDYYGYDEEQRQYRPLQFRTESRHFELAAGVLSPEQEVFIQDLWLFFRPDEMDEVREGSSEIPDVLDAARRLQQRPDLIAWFPYIRSMQLEQIAVHESRLMRARSALEILRSYARSIKTNEASNAP